MRWKCTSLFILLFMASCDRISYQYRYTSLSEDNDNFLYMVFVKENIFGVNEEKKVQLIQSSDGEIEISSGYIFAGNEYPADDEVLDFPGFENVKQGEKNNIYLFPINRLPREDVSDLYIEKVKKDCMYYLTVIVDGKVGWLVSDQEHLIQKGVHNDFKDYFGIKRKFSEYIDLKNQIKEKKGTFFILTPENDYRFEYLNKLPYYIGGYVYFDYEIGKTIILEGS